MKAANLPLPNKRHSQRGAVTGVASLGCGAVALTLASPPPPPCHPDRWVAGPPTCHPEREGGGSGGREGSPHKSWCRSTGSAAILRSLPDPRNSQRLCGFGEVHRSSSTVHNHPPCHPEREGGGSGGREGSPHKSWCRSTGSAAILRSLPDPHPSLRMTGNFDLLGSTIASSLGFSDRAITRLPRNSQCLCGFLKPSISIGCTTPEASQRVAGGGARSAKPPVHSPRNRPRTGSQKRHDFYERVCDPCRGRNQVNSGPVAARLRRLPPATVYDASGVRATPRRRPSAIVSLLGFSARAAQRLRMTVISTCRLRPVASSLPRNSQCLCGFLKPSISEGSRWWSAKRETTGT